MATDAKMTAWVRRPEDAPNELSAHEREHVLEELKVLLASRHFCGSRRCSDFLLYVVRQALDGKFSSLKERALGIQLFHRSPDYDTNADPVVRATAGEIRKKLAQHYQEVQSVSLRILLPVGSYVPHFQFEISPPPASRNDIETPQVCPRVPSPVPAPARRITQKQVWLGAAALCGLLALLGGLAVRILSARAVASARISAQTPAVLESFWGSFAGPSADTVAVFSTVGSRAGRSSGTSMRFPIGISTGSIASPGISGVGEVMGVHALDGVFAALHRSLRVKRSNFFTFDDAGSEDVIFLGSPLANSPLRLLQNSGDFLFQVVETAPGSRALAIVNTHPAANEPAEFLSTPSDLPTRQDFAVIALLPGMQPANKVLILAGITTFGTQAAAEFVSRSSSLEALLHRLHRNRNGEIEPFEAVISVRIDDEVPLDAKIVAVHSN